MKSKNIQYLSTFYWGLGLISKEKYESMTDERKVYVTEFDPSSSDIKDVTKSIITKIVGLKYPDC